MTKVRVLQIFSGGGTFNGIASSIYQQHKFVDRSKIHYDFYFTNQNSLSSVMEDPIFDKSKFTVAGATINGSNSNDYLTIWRKLKCYLKENDYDYIIVNSSVIELVAVCLFASKHLGNTKFIAHAHNSGLYIKNNARRNRVKFLTDIISKVCKNYIRKNASYLFGCSKEAIRETFGQIALDQKNIIVVRNAVELDKFYRRENIRLTVRKENGATNATFVFGSVGSLVPIKNQGFLIKLFSELLKEKPESILWLIGQGSERGKLELLSRELGIDNKIKFFGQRMDVPQLMQGMDAFVFTSLSEGLGIAAIEAQAAGLPTIVSDGVPDEALITKLSKKLPLSKDEGYWAKEILKHVEKCKVPYDYEEDIKNAGYDAFEEGKRMTEFFVLH